MSDENQQAAGSSTAVVDSPDAFTVPTDPKEYADWRTTGKLPEPKAKPQGKAPKPAETAARSEHQPAGDEESTEEDAPESGAGNQPSHARRRNSAETRLTELLADLKTAGLSPAELKTFKREASRPADSAGKPQQQPEQTAKPADPKAPVMPKMSDKNADGTDKYKTYEEFRNAEIAYIEDLADYKAKQAIANHGLEQQRAQARQEVQAGLAKAIEKYGDEAGPMIIAATQAIANDQQISQPVKDMLDSTRGNLANVMFVLCSKPEDYESFVAEARANPPAAMRRLVLVEQMVKQELAKGSTDREDDGDGDGEETPARGADGKFLKPAAAKTETKPHSKAPPPPREAGGRKSAPPDELQAAIDRGDMRAFRELENRREIAARRGH